MVRLRNHVKRDLNRILSVLTILAFVLGSNTATTPALAQSAPAAANKTAPAAAQAVTNPTNSFRLRVESARQWVPSGLNQHDPIPVYHWVVVQDDTGDPSHYGTNLGPTDTRNSNYACTPQSQGGDPAYPANCQWPAIHSVKAGTTAVGGPAGAQDSEIVAQGDQTDFAPDGSGNPTLSIDTTGWAQNDHNPNRSYMISVTAEGYTVPGCVPLGTVTCHVDGFKIDGAYFSLPLQDNGANQPNVTVTMQPYPLPLTTVRMQVWNDLQTNGAYDTGEPYLQGFEGHIADVLGPVTNDWYGNPLCTTYQHDASGLLLFGSNGRPLIQTIGGHCFSDANGVITIPYLGSDRYSSTVTPPNGQTWYQTSTLEGWHDWDTWAIQGWNGYDPEFVQGAEPFPFAEFGFVQLQNCAAGAANPSVGQTGACSTAVQTALGANASTAPNTATATSAGSISGTVVGIGEFSPQVGGLNFGGNGKHIIENINQPLVSLIDTGRDDNTVWVGRGDANGKFTITNVPDGDYVLTFWDEDQAYLLTQANVSIVNGQVVDMGVLDVAAWHSQVYGKVCVDANRNGKCDPGEQGIPNLVLNLLGRDNSVQFYGDNASQTDTNGNYRFPRTYPLGQWVVQQGYWEQFYTVGVTFQTNNQPSETTVMANGGFVDLSTFNLIGDQTRIDWAVRPYETDPTLGPVNGGIVGEMAYDVTRNETDARFSFNEMYQPGISGIPVHLYAPVKCDPTLAPPTGTACTATTTAFGTGNYLTNNDPTSPQYGAYLKLSDSSGHPLDLFPPYTSETWKRPTDCVARGGDGSRVVEQVLPAQAGDTTPYGVDPGGHDCLEAPMMSSQVGDNSVGPFMQVTGNYGFTLACFDVSGNPGGYDAAATAANSSGTVHCLAGYSVQSLPPADYIVQPEIPTDPRTGKAVLEVTKEEEVNIMSGDFLVAPGETPINPPLPNRTPPGTITPAIPPFPCVGPLHTVHVVSTVAAALYDLANPTTTSGIYNPDFLSGGGSPYEGLQKPQCDARLVTVRNGRSATPNFYWHTQGTKSTAPVPLPGRVFGIVVDDVNLSVNPKELFYGEKFGIPNLPIGIYDFANHLVRTIESDPQGAYEAILPSTSSYNCPLPAGPCPAIYRFLANDPGQPGHPNLNYNPAYRTIGGFFEVWPGLSLPTDLAPSPVAFAIENPGSQQTHPAACLLNDPTQANAPAVPDVFSIDTPYVLSSQTGVNRNRTITGQYFGDARGTVLVDGHARPGWIQSWTDTQIVIRPPASFTPGPHLVLVQSANGQKSVNGITVHVLGGSGPNAYNPTILEVGPGRTFDPGAASHNTGGYEHAVQDALDAAAQTSSPKLVVVYPNTPDLYNPFGSYFENIIIHSPVKLQGVGPGGNFTDPNPNAAGLLGTAQPGSVLDGLGFGTDGARDTGWQTTLTNAGAILGPGGVALDPATVAPPEGEVILAVANSTSQYTIGYKAAVDGFTIQNGDVMDFVPNINSLGNGTQVGGGNNAPTNPNQGGAFVALASTRYFQLTDNIIRSNTGAYGAVRIGTPLVGDNHNDGVRIANNRILNNGGSNLAGAVGIFNGAYGYEVSNNDVCGNFSAEYGGGISHFGLTGNLVSSNTSTNGTRSASGTWVSSIRDNRIYFNGSYDEGGGVIIAGEPPTNLTSFGAGAGPVNLYNNIIEANMGGDDGGGLRFLTAGNFPYNVYNNMIVNNISAHEGGGVAIDNAPNLRFYNNTVMKNITTATAATSNGQPAPAGLSTAPNNGFLQATLPAGSPSFSNPLLFNNIFWDNRAGRWDGANIVGIGGLVWSNGAQVPDPTPINHWDMGVPGTANQLAPTNSVLQSETTNHNDVAASSTNRVDQDPLVIQTFDTTVYGQPWRGNPNFVANVIVAQDVPVTIMGNYHLSGTASSAYNLGAASDAVPTYQRPPNNLNAPAFDIDSQVRPAQGGYDSGADEFPGYIANLAITKTDGQTQATIGTTFTYTITVTNNGPDPVLSAPVVDNFPAVLTNVSWTCTSTIGVCADPSGTGNINTLVDLPYTATATFTATVTLGPTAVSGSSLSNTAQVSPPAFVTDPNTTNNSVTDTDTILNPGTDLAITNTASAATVGQGQPITYTIVATNNGPSAVMAAPVTDSIPAALTAANWSCAAVSGNCAAASGSGSINTTVDLQVGGTATFTLNGVVAANATGSLVTSASIFVPSGMTDPVPANNTAATTTRVTTALPALGVLDNFNRANANTLGSNWSQVTFAGLAAIRVNGNQASDVLVPGQAMWNGTGNVFGNTQAAAITLTSNTITGTALLLKASGGTASTPSNFIRVRINAANVQVQTSGGTTLATFAATFANGDTLTAVVDATGKVGVWQNANYLGSTGANASFTGTGRIGLILPAGGMGDNYSGGNVLSIVLADAGIPPFQQTFLPVITN